jgi:bacterial/archaeal transporter family protein
MVDGAASSGEKRQPARPSGYSQSLTGGAAAAAAPARSAVGDQDEVTGSTGYPFNPAPSGQPSEILSADFTATPVPKSLATVISAAANTLKRSWFWYSIAASLCWTAWAFTARLGSEEIPPTTMQFVSAFGFLLVSLVMVAVQRPQLQQSLRGNFYALVSGLLLGLGGIALYGAYRAGDNASVVTATTSLYPVATVLLAVTFLREKINRLQLLGVCFAVAAILLLSL